MPLHHDAQGRGFEHVVLHMIVTGWRGWTLARIMKVIGEPPDGGWPAEVEGDAMGEVRATGWEDQEDVNGFADFLRHGDSAKAFRPTTTVGADVVLQTSTHWLVSLTLKLHSAPVADEVFKRNVSTSDLRKCYSTKAEAETGRPPSGWRKTRRDECLTLLTAHPYRVANDGHFLVRIVVTLPTGPKTGKPNPPQWQRMDGDLLLHVTEANLARFMGVEDDDALLKVIKRAWG